MAEPIKDDIKKVQISDVEKPQDDAAKGSELNDSQLERVSGGGGGYTCPACGLAACACGG